MHRIYGLLICCCLYGSHLVFAQKPRNGIYTYAIAWDEWGGKILGATCTVIIKGDSIKVLHDGKPGVTGTKGDVMDEGLIRRHKKTGKWIIAHSEKDIHAKDVGGCSDGPTVIDFVKKQWHSC